MSFKVKNQGQIWAKSLTQIQQGYKVKEPKGTFEWKAFHSNRAGIHLNATMLGYFSWGGQPCEDHWFQHLTWPTIKRFLLKKLCLSCILYPLCWVKSCCLSCTQYPCWCPHLLHLQTPCNFPKCLANLRKRTSDKKKTYAWQKREAP